MEKEKSKQHGQLEFTIFQNIFHFERKKFMRNRRKNKQCQNSNQSTRYDHRWINEYQMMREELVDYMDKLQTVRSMMYAAVGAVIALSFSKTIPFIYTLLPLLFIIPAYMTAIDYWVCVRKASAYLVVFHESYADCPIHWESRHNMLKKRRKRKKENFKKSVFNNIPAQLAAYYACALFIMLIYSFQLYEYAATKKSSNSPSNSFNLSMLPVWIYVALGAVVAISSVIFFIRSSKGESYDWFLASFLTIKEKEEQTKIGKCWANEGRYLGDFDSALEAVERRL